MTQATRTLIPDDDALEVMVDAMIKQSTAYPIVPPGYTGKVEPLHPFAARQCLLAALRAQAEATAPEEPVEEDTRPNIGGYPLPWKISEPSEHGSQEILDADGDSVIGCVEDDEFYAALVPFVNRALAIEAALAGFREIGDEYWDDHGEPLSEVVTPLLASLGISDKESRS